MLPQEADELGGLFFAAEEEIVLIDPEGAETGVGHELIGGGHD